MMAVTAPCLTKTELSAERESSKVSTEALGATEGGEGTGKRVDEEVAAEVDWRRRSTKAEAAREARESNSGREGKEEREE